VNLAGGGTDVPDHGIERKDTSGPCKLSASHR
jgi:hypothetical protein